MYHYLLKRLRIIIIIQVWSKIEHLSSLINMAICPPVREIGLTLNLTKRKFLRFLNHFISATFPDVAFVAVLMLLPGVTFDIMNNHCLKLID